MRKVVRGLVDDANQQGADTKAIFIMQLNTIASELAETVYAPAAKEEQITRLQQIVDILRANGAIA